MEKLLPYYERELALLRGRMREFAERFPKLGELFGLQGERSPDAGVERLLQVAALLYARIVRKMERSHERFTNDLLGVQAPFYLRPIPSCSVVQVDGAGGRAIATVPRGTELHAKAVPGCGFRTVYDAAVAPITVTVRFMARSEAPATLGLPAGIGCAIAIAIETADPAIALDEAAGSRVRLFIDADGPARAALQDAMFMHTVCTCVESEQQWRKLPTLPFEPVGFAKEEAFLPTPWRQEESLRLLTEYFAFPEKFDFIDMDLKAVLATCPVGARRLALHLLLPDMHATTTPQLLRTLPPAALRLGCAPVVNVFSRATMPIRLRKGRSAYPVAMQRTSGAKATVYSIDAMKLMQGADDGSTAVDMNWFYNKQYETQHCWTFELADPTMGTGDTVSFVNRLYEPLSLGEGTVTAQVTCTNGDAPCSMPIGQADGDLAGEPGCGGMPIRMLRRPSAPLLIADEAEGHWKLIAIAHASNRDDAQQDARPLLDLLRMHARSGCVVTARQLSGIVKVERRIVQAWIKFRRGAKLEKGYEVTLTIDVAAFAGRSIHVFAQVMERVLGYYLVYPAFLCLNIKDTDGRELVRGALRHGPQSPA
jgi:type VI secretion system protein ImpG